MANPPPLAMGCTYHVYNRGTNGETLFRTRRNYLHFLRRYADYVHPVAETYAYCLMGNHFHLAIRTRTQEEQAERHPEVSGGEPFVLLSPSRQFSKLFNAYAKAYNHECGRTGSLFEHPFRRKMVDDERYFWRLITYIHRNPAHHGFVEDFREWPYSSYGALLSGRPTRLNREAVLEGLGGRDMFVAAHGNAEYEDIGELLIDMD
ncbi:MAG: hypothetical protein JXC32_13730 [Anaerolineae bacterium]|nr:hypothetical protein [Anaerolineae bacterium]